MFIDDFDLSSANGSTHAIFDPSSLKTGHHSSLNPNGTLSNVNKAANVATAKAPATQPLATRNQQKQQPLTSAVSNSTQATTNTNLTNAALNKQRTTATTTHLTNNNASPIRSSISITRSSHRINNPAIEVASPKKVTLAPAIVINRPETRTALGKSSKNALTNEKRPQTPAKDKKPQTNANNNLSENNLSLMLCEMSSIRYVFNLKHNYPRTVKISRVSSLGIRLEKFYFKINRNVYENSNFIFFLMK
jgi:hypothetical protein